MGMNKYLVILRINGQLIKTAVHANSATHARLLCQYQFGMNCVQVAPTQINSEGQGYPLLDDLIAESPPSIKPHPPKPPKPKTIKPAKPPTPEQMRLTQLKANVDRQKEALKQERERQKRQREAEQARRGPGGY
jgi:type IV secretory pathway VirB10-like protein